MQALHLGGVPGGLPDRGAFRTEFDTVVVQADVCNGCGYCVPACPFGVIDRHEDDGRAFKCTLCYDRLRAGAFFLLLDEPEVYGLPPDPVSTTRDLPTLWRAAALAAGALAAGVAAGVPLLVSDLGRPERFPSMLRVVKVTSPLSVGGWVLAAMGPAAAGAAVADRLGVFPRLGRAAEAVAGLLGRPWPPTPAPWWPTRPCRCGTRPAASCRSCWPGAPAAVSAGVAAVLAGSMGERWAVYQAGFQSARDPRYIVEPQRARLVEREREQPGQ